MEVIIITRKTREIPGIYNQVSDGVLTITRRSKITGATVSVTRRRPTATPNVIGPRGYQVTDSENHSFAWKTGGRDSYLVNPHAGIIEHVPPGYDVGGAFFSYKLECWSDRPTAQALKGTYDPGGFVDYTSNYTGQVWPAMLVGISDLIPSASQSDLTAKGTTAIAQIAPTNSVASAANFLAELRSEGIPKLFGATLWKERSRQFADLKKSAGDEYLNVKFGWDPFVGDIKDIAFAVTHGHETLSQFERDSGRVVRRRFEFPVEETRSTSLIGGRFGWVGDYSGAFPEFFAPSFDVVSNLLRGSGGSDELYRTRHTYRRCWFSGAFTYHLPTGYDSRNKMIESARHAQTLLGLDITPEVLWNATPWTWAIDWFSNAGDVVANLSNWAVYGQVLKYGYMMENIIVTDTYFAKKRAGFADPRCAPSTITVRLETKRRQKATPFGFGMSWSGLNPIQLSIAAALGLTKGWF